MKNILFIALMMITAIAVSFPACSGSVDQDAQQLAVCQKERVRTIKTMLETDDPIQLNICRLELIEQTSKYNNFKNRMEMKYEKQKERARFEEAYRRALE